MGGENPEHDQTLIQDLRQLRNETADAASSLVGMRDRAATVQLPLLSPDVFPGTLVERLASSLDQIGAESLDGATTARSGVSFGNPADTGLPDASASHESYLHVSQVQLGWELFEVG